MLSASAVGIHNAHAQTPTGGDVGAGQAAIARAGSMMDVTASTHRTIVNWDTFDVGAGNTASFHLPGADAAILNRVTSTDMPSTIAAALNSNGNVYLVNPSGHRSVWISGFRQPDTRWIWGDSPEAGDHFFTTNSGSLGGTTSPGQYSNF